ncbi:MAG TPA: radical SAM protein [Chloroflexota bacterium]
MTAPMADTPSDDRARAYDDGSWLELSSYCPACGRWVAADDPAHQPVPLPARLWIYTNYDCNLSCSYCLVSSNPWAERRGIGLGRVRRLLDEAHALGVAEVFFTGGEPFILPEIYDMIAAATPRFLTTVLSNAMIIRKNRLEKLKAVNHPNLRIQVSLDDSEPGVHDLYRGQGAWTRTMAGIRLLQESRVQVRIATTVTPEGEPRVPAVRAFVRDVVGVPDEHHIVRPLLKRGFAETGMEVGKSDLIPEITVDANGVYWHPVGTDADLLVTPELFPLRAAIEEIGERMKTVGTAGKQPFR